MGCGVMVAAAAVIVAGFMTATLPGPCWQGASVYCGKFHPYAALGWSLMFGGLAALLAGAGHQNQEPRDYGLFWLWSTKVGRADRERSRFASYAEWPCLPDNGLLEGRVGGIRLPQMQRRAICGHAMRMQHGRRP